jgi:hypothetical protein
MKSKILISIVCLVLYLVPFANAAIYIDGQLYSGNTLNIMNSSYNNHSIVANGTSLVNIYGNQEDGEYNFAYISLSENSVANVFYEDEYYDGWTSLECRPGIRFNIIARDNSVINLISEDYDFVIQRWDWVNDVPVWLDVCSGLQINTIDYPLFASSSTIWRDYSNLPPGIGFILAPVVGDFCLQNNAVVNFIPEPATIALCGIAVPLILRKKRQS